MAAASVTPRAEASANSRISSPGAKLTKRGAGVAAGTLDGGGVGRGAHSLDESYDDRADGFKGPQWILLVVIGLLTSR